MIIELKNDLIQINYLQEMRNVVQVCIDQNQIIKKEISSFNKQIDEANNDLTNVVSAK